MTHSELVERGAKWLKYNKDFHYRSTIILKEFSCMSSEIPDVLGFSHYYSTLIECKLSMADFKADRNKRCRNKECQLGLYRLYLCPAGLINKDNLPSGWGLLYCYPNKVTIEVEPTENDIGKARTEEHYVLYSIVRRACIRGLLPELVKPIKEVSK